MIPAKSFFNKDSLVLACIAAVIFIFFLFLAKFSIPAITISLAGAIGFYLFRAKDQNEFLVYSLICSIFFIIFTLIKNNTFPIWLAILITGSVLYILIYYFYPKNRGKHYSILAIILAFSEIVAIISFINLPLIINSLIILLIFYFFISLISQKESHYEEQKIRQKI